MKKYIVKGMYEIMNGKIYINPLSDDDWICLEDYIKNVINEGELISIEIEVK